ncbi:hypothetical protein [Vibrio sp. 10N.239.312.D08]|uniref:hypothetical protein n=1 Tax=Vibrio sp. 10N.239.312.D08 TaxID=3229978 RepID=UPI00354EEA1E
MTEHIEINLDKPVEAPVVDSSLTELLVDYYGKWPESALSATQSYDGEVVWWQVSKEEIAAVISEHKPINNDLLPYIGVGHVVDSDYPELDNYAVCASDWRGSIVSAEEFITMKGTR